MLDILFDTWSGIGRVVIVGVLAYLALVLMLRVSGKRTLAKMNAFDFIVTIALGSTLATILLTDTVALAEGVVALGLLIGLQFVITWLSVRSDTVSSLVKGAPTLLLYEGQLLRPAMRAERVTDSEILAAIRQQGMGSREQITAVVLETDGSLNVIPRRDDGSALADVSSKP